jgi:O-antigen/teichoic acid export membrane protein
LDNVTNLISARGVKRSTVLNLSGAVIPIFAALVAIPILADGLGIVSFGVLGIVWAISGYLGFLDFGLGRALTRYVADLLARGQPHDARLATRTAVLLLGGLGIGTGLILISLSPWIASHLDLPPVLANEARLSFVIVGFSAPAALVSTAFVGLLESHQRFDYVNAVRIPYGTATFVVPSVLVAWFGAGVAGVVLSIVLLRIAALIPYAVLTSRTYLGSQSPGLFNHEAMRALARFGGWLTVSNLASPFLMSSDRFVIGVAVSVAAVGIYTAPYEAAIRLLVIPVAISGVTFAAVAGSLPFGGRRPGRILAGSLFATCAAMIPLLVSLSAFAPELLEGWLGPELGEDGVAVFQLLAVGIFINSVATQLFASILAGNRADWAAKLHLAEVPIYLVALLLIVPEGGIVAAAALWTARVTIDGVAVAVLATRIVRMRRIDTSRIAGLLAIAILLLVTLPLSASPLARAVGCCAAFVIAGVALRWANSAAT